ncbi:MAG: T9SS type A sorting domain-containing protein [Bacteroidota bacterium]
MKTVSAILISTFITSFVSAQSFDITHGLDPADVSGTTIYYSNLSPDTNLTTYFSLINHSGDTQVVTVKRLKLDVPATWQDAIGWQPFPDPDFQGIHYPPNAANPWTTLGSVTLPDNGTAMLTVDYFLTQEIGDGVYRYYFMNDQTPLDSVDVYLSMVLSTNELPTESILLYPNPAKTTVQFSKAPITAARIFDLNGKCIINDPEINNNQLSIAQLSDGIYQIVLETEHGIQSQKLVVRH